MYQQPGGFPGGQCPLQPPTPFKTFENWNYCHTHGGDVNNTHTSMLCRNPGLSHNLNATRTNTMGGNRAGLHRTILPSASDRVPLAPCQSQAPAPPMWQQSLPPVNFTPMMAAICPMMRTTPLPGHQLHGPPVWTSPSTVWTTPPAVPPPAPPPPTSCGNDDAVLQSVPAASKLLMVMGKQS